MLQVKWATCGDDHHWCDFLQLIASKIKAEGVYVIWRGGSPSKVVRVGQGIIANRLGAHRVDPEIMAHKQLGLYVTWATVPAGQRGGVERYLGDVYHPLTGDAFPDVDPIEVNLPGL